MNDLSTVTHLDIANVFQAGLRHHEAARLHEAKLLYQKVLRLDPTHVEALSLLATIAYQEARYDIAIEYLRRLVSLRPTVMHYRMQLGRNLQALGRYEEAETHFQKNLLVNPESVAIRT